MHPSLLGLTAYKQFVIYATAPRNDGSGKLDKWTINVHTGLRHDAHDPTIWMDAQTAENIATAWGVGYGYGFVFTEHDPFWFLDIDCALIPADPTTGQPARWADVVQQVCSIFAGCAVEVSTSGTGLHIFGRGTPPPHRCANKPLGLEFYHKLRFAALTGTSAYGDVNTDASAVLGQFCASYFPGRPEGEEAEWQEGPVPEWRGPTDDDELIRRARQSRSSASSFGGKASFDDLWTANEAALSRTYPDPARAWDGNAADQAMANHLSFWTGKDCPRIERIMRRSALAREKWDSPRPEGTYLTRTIMLAVEGGGDVLKDEPPRSGTPAASAAALAAPQAPGTDIPADGPLPPPQKAIPDVATDQIELRGGSADGFMLRKELYDHFVGCIYVRSLHRAYVPGGLLLRPEQFKVTYGGWRFQIDKLGDKSTRDAWEAFTLNEIYKFPAVEGVCFRPDLPTGTVMNEPGHSAVNTFIPIEVPRKQGDPAPFLRHVAKILPNERDAAIMLSYMAACVQHQGIKFQWAPLLQGVEGNGKTLLTRCVAEAIGRRYTHFPPANEISEKFNSWLFDSIFIGVEDIYVPNQRQEVFEILKPMITSEYLAKRAMQTDQVMRNVVANFIFNSNHKDGLRKTENDRRVCVLFCAQQEKEDLARDGMTSEYFSDLYDWLKADGYAIVTDFLHTYAIPDELNPAKDCQRAPETTSTTEAISVSLGNIEQEIMEAIDQEQQGFCGGWISSHWLDRLLERMGLIRKVSPHRRKEILATLGYRHHPAFKDGRTTGIVTPDNTRPRLYIHDQSIAKQIIDPAVAAKEYERLNTLGLRVAIPLTFGRQSVL